MAESRHRGRGRGGRGVSMPIAELWERSQATTGFVGSERKVPEWVDFRKSDENDNFFGGDAMKKKLQALNFFKESFS